VQKKRKDRVERRKLADGTIKTYRYAPKIAASPESKIVSGVMAAWQRSPNWAKLSPNTATAYVRYSAYLYDVYKSVPIVNIKRRHILEIRDDLARENGHGAADGFCRAVSSFFSWAVDRDYIEASPATRLKGDLTRGAWKAWTLEQALHAETNLPTIYARSVLLARHTGQRRGDLCKFRWSDYDGSSLKLIQQKTKREMVIPASAELRAALDAWKREANGLTILTNALGEPMKVGVLSTTLPRELQRIGLPSGLNIHGLRKLAATQLAEAGCSAHEIKAITGHVTLQQVEVYTKSVDQRVLSQSAVVRLENAKKLKTR
jgi:integrase